jgi:hypothetical protein
MTHNAIIPTMICRTAFALKPIRIQFREARMIPEGKPRKYDMTLIVLGVHSFRVGMDCNVDEKLSADMILPVGKDSSETRRHRERTSIKLGTSVSPW